MPNRLDGKIALITGGASGIGRRTAEIFVEEGATVVLGDRNEELLREVEGALGEHACSSRLTDVTNESDLEALLGHAVGRYGRVDVAINCAGFGTYAPLPEYPSEDWQSVIDVCLTGIFYSVKHESRQMITQDTGGAIVNIASISGRQPGENMVAYCSAKAGVEMLTRVAGLELGRKRVRVNAIAPGFIETPLTAVISQFPEAQQKFLDSIPVGRAGQPDDIAHAALYLASDEASFVNSEILVVDGGAMQREYPRM
jgi:3-oxoacyl-[acyl-carrier protein] reductase